ncbi:MAG: HEAT repeat domain-containing protein [Anaerolineaceae bacterium]|nr:HEAT repeat domain-containing protein [Anaerolineaceae bacterium]
MNEANKNMNDRESTPFQNVISDLLDNNKPFSAVHHHRFSDPSSDELAEIKKVWPQVNPDRKAALLEGLELLTETDYLLCFDDLCYFVIEDQDPRVRASAARILSEAKNPKLIPRFIEMMKNDDDEVVRATAASVLGVFVYLGELEEISLESFKMVENSLLEIYNSGNREIIRRKALESLGFSNSNEIARYIKDAYASEKMGWRSSALVAMTRTADNRWNQYVIDALEETDEEIRIEAIRAAGELEIGSARPTLLEILSDFEFLDSEIRLALIWSLSQIGGGSTRQAIESLLKLSDDFEDIEFIETALENLRLTDGFQKSYDMFLFDDQDEIDEIDSETRFDDIEDEDEDIF